MAEKQVTVRVKVAGDRVTQTFRLYGAEGEKALSRISAAARVQGRALERNAGQFRRTQAAGAAFGGGMRNVSLQLSQVAQQASATGDWMRALAIQLPDLALGFGTIGIAIGALAGVALPLLAEKIMGGSDSARTMQDRVSELEAATTAYRRAAENAAMPTAKLRDEFVTAAEGARHLFDVQKRYAQLDLASRLQETRTAIADMFGDLTGAAEETALAFPAVASRIEELRQEMTQIMADPAAPADQVQAIKQELTGLVAVYGDVESAVTQLRAQFELSEEAASDLVAAALRFRDAGDYEARSAALQGLIDLTFAAADANSELSDRERELLEPLLAARRAMIDFLVISEEGTGTVSGTAAAAGRLADEVNRAAQAAINFVSNLGQANLAGIRAEVAALEAGADKISAKLESRRAEIWADPNFQRALNSPIPDIREEALAGRSRDLAQLEEELRLIERRNAAYRGMSQTAGSAATSTQQLTAAQRIANQVLGEAQQAAVTYSDVVAVLDEKLRSGEISQEAYAEALERVRARMGDLAGATDQVNQRFGDLVAGVLTGAQEMDRVLAQLGQRLLSLAFNGLFDIIGLGSVGGLFGFAEGTPDAPGGYALVGERGPELMRLPGPDVAAGTAAPRAAPRVVLPPALAGRGQAMLGPAEAPARLMRQARRAAPGQIPAANPMAGPMVNPMVRGAIPRRLAGPAARADIRVPVPPGHVIVGAAGPEVIRVPRGARVIPAGRTRAILGALPPPERLAARAARGRAVLGAMLGAPERADFLPAPGDDPETALPRRAGAVAPGPVDLHALLRDAGLPGFAEGTPAAPGGPAWTGERGPELMRMPQASMPGAMAPPPGAAPDRRSEIDVNIRMQDGTFVADVQRISGDVAVRTSQAMLQSYDRQILPRSVERISNDPRRRG